MKAVIFIGLLFFVVVVSTAQTALPNVILDSMIFEVKQGRQCSQVIKAQANELEAIGKELLTTGTALKLSQSESKTLSALWENEKNARAIDGKQFYLDRDKLKKKVRKRTILVVGEAVLIIVLLL